MDNRSKKISDFIEDNSGLIQKFSDEEKAQILKIISDPMPQSPTGQYRQYDIYKHINSTEEKYRLILFLYYQANIRKKNLATIIKLLAADDQVDVFIKIANRLDFITHLKIALSLKKLELYLEKSNIPYIFKAQHLEDLQTINLKSEHLNNLSKIIDFDLAQKYESLLHLSHILKLDSFSTLILSCNSNYPDFNSDKLLHLLLCMPISNRYLLLKKLGQDTLNKIMTLHECYIISWILPIEDKNKLIRLYTGDKQTILASDQEIHSNILSEFKKNKGSKDNFDYHLEKKPLAEAALAAYKGSAEAVFYLGFILLHHEEIKNYPLAIQYFSEVENKEDAQLYLACLNQKIAEAAETNNKQDYIEKMFHHHSQAINQGIKEEANGKYNNSFQQIKMFDHILWTLSTHPSLSNFTHANRYLDYCLPEHRSLKDILANSHRVDEASIKSINNICEILKPKNIGYLISLLPELTRHALAIYLAKKGEIKEKIKSSLGKLIDKELECKSLLREIQENINIKYTWHYQTFEVLKISFKTGTKKPPMAEMVLQGRIYSFSQTDAKAILNLISYMKEEESYASCYEKVMAHLTETKQSLLCSSKFFSHPSILDWPDNCYKLK